MKNRDIWICFGGVLLGVTLAAPRAAADTGSPRSEAPSPGLFQSNAPGVPAPPPASRPQNRGFLALPYVGLHSYQHETATDRGPGARLGILVGTHLGEVFSLNGEVTFDRSNINATTTTVTTREWFLEAALSPLFHLPAGSLDVVLGPKVGLFMMKAGGPMSSGDVTGMVAGVNSGLFMPVSRTTSLGVVLSYGLRHSIQDCATIVGNICAVARTAGFAQVLGMTAAAMF